MKFSEKQFFPDQTQGTPVPDDKENNIDVNSLSIEQILAGLRNETLNKVDTSIAHKLIDAGKESDVLRYNHLFLKFDKEIANKLATSMPIFVVNYLDKFEPLDTSIAIKIIEHGQGHLVLNNLEKFKELDYNQIASKLIDQGRDLKESVARNLEKFHGLNTEIANRLISKENGWSIARNIDKFEGINYNEIAIKLIVRGCGEDVVENLEKFKGLDYNQIAKTLIEESKEYFLLDNLSKFKSLEPSIALELLESLAGKKVIANLASFKDLNDEEIVNKALEEDVSGLKHDLNKFKGLNPEIVKYVNDFQSKNDSDRVYKLRNTYSLQEIMNNYDSIRVKAWEQKYALEKEDEEIFKELKNFIAEETLGELWSNNKKEELHIIGPQIIKMYELSRYKPDTFRGQFLEKIINDNSDHNIPRALADYDGEETNDHPANSPHINLDSLHYFNNIVENLDKDFGLVLAEASSFEQTRALAEKLKQEGPFKDWESLKKYYELAELLKEKEVLEKLENLKKEGRDKQYKFFSDLAFHPGSKIPMQTVFQFMEDPARFLDVEDEHSKEAHERKKPSNYTKFNYLDISADDLRDALIEGTLDKLQYFKPFEAGYKIADRNYSNEEIISYLKDALGSFRESIKGNAKNPGKLFKETQGILKKHNIEYKDLVSNPLLLTNEVKSDLEKLLFDDNFGIKDDRKFEEYIVKIHPKSSPEGHLAGNDTACCMPFGSGKNNVYMYNLGCSVLTVQRKSGDNKYRTIAQSVLTPDVDIKHNIADLVSKVQNETLLSSVITEDLTQKKNIVITADNIEVAPNAGKYKSSIETIYADFVSRYAHAIESNEIEKDRMLIGKGYSDLNFSRSKLINNTFIPTTPVAYSDNYGSEVYELPLTDKSEIIPLPNYGMLQKQEKEIPDPDLPKGISYLTAHDTLRVSYMEGKVYAENESLVQYIHRIGNELTAKDINNNFKNRPNLSLKVEDENDAMLGYMIAYEGAMQDDESQKVIYISDLAADISKSKLSGGRLIKAFKTLIKREYLDKGNLIPIVMEARESTSYKIIQSQLGHESTKNSDKDYGYKFKIQEEGSEEKGGETMHFIKLVPEKI